ncbi:exonuclease RecJ [Natronomonas sp. EA1]|uniref:exonuclease RecJ n=1 Tax=Natronomonas sp. EA1 TaxID=3421655 RepID=UPI003EBD41A5
MSTAGRPDAPAPAASASDVATACREADFVSLVATASGDALAALGVVARALRTADVPFQARVRQLPRPSMTEADVTVTVGAPGGDLAILDTPCSLVAYEAARELGASPDPTLALAGAVASGEPEEAGHLLESAPMERRPGIAIPVADVSDGLAHSTLAHARFSGSPETAMAALADLELPAEMDETAHRRLASFAALAAVEDATPQAAEAVERFLRPFVGGPFETLGGYADVLDAVARERPGVGVALALGGDARTEALDAWREHALAAHRGLREADTGRYDGLFVVRTDGPVSTVARLARDYRAPEPVVLALSEGEAATAGTRDVAYAFRQAVDAIGGEQTAHGRTGYARDIDEQDLIAAYREAL